MKTICVKLSEIVTTAGTQVRAAIDTDIVDQYAEDMLNIENKFPPIVIFHDGSQYVLADGFHRVMAAVRNGFKDIQAEIHKGTKTDALKYALGSNVSHGLRRTNADKRRAVELALAEWPKLSNKEVARICCVSDMLVRDIRQPQESCSSNPLPRIGKDGKIRRLPKRKRKIVFPEPDEEVDSEQRSVPHSKSFVVDIVALSNRIQKEAKGNQLDSAVKQWEKELANLKLL